MYCSRTLTIAGNDRVLDRQLYGQINAYLLDLLDLDRQGVSLGTLDPIVCIRFTQYFAKNGVQIGGSISNCRLPFLENNKHIAFY